MNDELKPVREYPDISFIDSYTVERLENDMVGWFKEKRKELTGEDTIPGEADDRRLLLKTGAYFIFQGYMFADDAGKMGLLKYSRGDFLENLGALKHIYRKPAAGATTTVRFRIREPRETTTGIPRNTRLTAGDGIYFATDEYGEILAGELYADIAATCTAPGSLGNRYEAGDIGTIVDPVPYIDSAANITKPENGADTEDDDSLRQRIFMAPSAYSTAGTGDAYRYFVKQFNPGITDVLVTSPEECVVEVRYLLAGGEIPGTESIKALEEYLSNPSIRPLSDRIHVMAPEQVSYDLRFTYFINRSDRERAGVIQKAVGEAVEQFKLWQRTKMGRDINQTELIRLVMAAGAKRLEVSSPAFSVVPEGAVASLGQEQVSYGGLEDD